MVKWEARGYKLFWMRRWTLRYLPIPDATAPVPPPVWAMVKSDLAFLRRAWQPITRKEVSKYSLGRKGAVGIGLCRHQWVLVSVLSSCLQRWNTDISLAQAITGPFQSTLRLWGGKCGGAEEALIFQDHISILLSAFFTPWKHPCRLSSSYVFLLCGPSSHIK